MKSNTASSELIKFNGKLAGCCLILLLVIAMPVSICGAATPKVRQATEYDIKAAYLYNFVLFVQWPESNIPPSTAADDKTFTIGIIGKDPFGNSFKDVEGKLLRYKKKKLVIKRYGPYRKTLGLGKCQVIFISSSEKQNLRTILARLKGKPVLTIAETPNFLKAGGMIRFVEKQKKIRWEINQTPVKKADLKFNSQLLRNAVRVVQIPKLPQRKNPDTPTNKSLKEKEN